MGGKVWSDEEEEVFWSAVARLAPPGLHQDSQAVKKGRKKKDHKGAVEDSWTPLVDLMVELMTKKLGEKPERKYSPISLYEHLFQNLIQGKLSPNASRHVDKHRAWLKTMAENPESAFEVEGSGSGNLAESDSSDSTASTESPGSESHTTLENSAPPNAIPQVAMRQQPQQMPWPQQPQRIPETQYLDSSGRMGYSGPTQVGQGFLAPLTAPTNGQQREGDTQQGWKFYDVEDRHLLPAPFNNREFFLSVPDFYRVQGYVPHLLQVKGKTMEQVLGVVRTDIFKYHLHEVQRFSWCLQAIDEWSAVCNSHQSSFPAEQDIIRGGQSRSALKRKRSGLPADNESRATEPKRQSLASQNPV